MIDAVTAAATQSTVRQASVPARQPYCIDSLAKQLGTDLAQVFLFVDSEADFDQLIRDAAQKFAGIEVVACTTAGEINTQGYSEGNVVAVAFPISHFQSSTLLIPDLDSYKVPDLIDAVVRQRLSLEARAKDFPNAFAFLVIDGMSLQEDQLMVAISSGMAALPVFGGSAGDGVRFQQPRVALNGVVHRNAAVITLVRTKCEIEVFCLDHFQPGDTRMVVTGADPSRRIVHEINARPAAREYARILGKNPDYLSRFTFAAHPVVVRVGGSHHVRAIHRMTDDGSLVFYSAIDEGIVLTLAKSENISEHLDTELSRISSGGKLDSILACDCVLRRIEATQLQQVSQVSSVLRKHNVVGFNTYGEQVGAKHVNQTMTGVAFFHPKDDS